MTYHARLDETAEWLNYLQPEGLVVGANVLRKHALTPIRQTPLDTDDAAKALGLDPDAPRDDDRHFTLADPWRFFEAVLEWPAKRVAGAPDGPPVAGELTKTLPEHETFLAPDMAILWHGVAEDGVPAQALVLLHPTLDADERNRFPGDWEASPHQRLERLVRETGVGVGILIARNTLRLVYAPRGETAGWLSWPLAALGRVEGRPMLAGLKLCLGRNAFFTGAPETRLRALLKASREAQNEVSAKLSGQVLGALHELLRGLHRAAPARIEALAESESHHLYEGLLTCLMRLVFLLYAEDRDLLPSSTDPQLRALWESGYSVKSLYARLLVDEALNPDTMDQRRGGWGQLLAVFRLIHAGHPDWVARRGGKLFDPEEFPFLEGRDKDSARKDGAVLPVSDGTILRILHGLMTVEGRSLSGEKIRERLSYRSLDVESIGSVYETVMGFTAKRATEPMVALKDEKKLPAFVGPDSLLAQKPADRQKWLKDQSLKLSAKQAKGIKEAGSAADLIAAFGGLVDERASPDRAPIVAGVPYLQPTAERRRSGSHYTPRSLTEPIVRHALEPAFERIGANASPEAVLALNVLDPACGSGAFLVEACRQLGARLEQAWDMHKAEKPPIPADEDEATHARRLVAQKCLYGVDRNPMAVDLARLSLWLATLAREHEFSFVDHALKSGDSLVGLTKAEIKAAHWDSSKPGLPLFRQMIEDAVDKALLGREAIRTAPDDVSLAVQTAKHRRVEAEVEPARVVGDAVIAAFFACGNARERETARAEVESWITGSIDVEWERVQEKARAFREARGWRPFHWEMEFPEVFARENPGFDAVVGNPPFLGGTRISTQLGKSYIEYLKHLYFQSGDRADLVAYFFRRSFVLLRQRGVVGLVASNSIAQGDTRNASLNFILSSGGSIFCAIPRTRWPGEAAVIISVVHFVKGALPRRPTLGLKQVDRISAYLLPGHQDADPNRLAANEGAAAEGMVPYGNGFRISPIELSTLQDEITASVFPFIGGKHFNADPEIRPETHIAYLRDLPLHEAQKNFPTLVRLLELRVRPDRESRSAEVATSPWWLFWRARVVLWEALQRSGGGFARSKVSSHHALAWLPAATIPDVTLVVFPTAKFHYYSIIQSRVHETWARLFASSMKDDLRYTPSDCFATFPFPPAPSNNNALEAIGLGYHEWRAELMAACKEGLTKTYNRFHQLAERGADIGKLRALHDTMDQAVLRAYGWDDLADTLRPQFLTPETEDDHTYQNRYFWPAEGRDLVLARLLALNAERHAEEVAAGIAPRSKGKSADPEADEDIDQESMDLG